MSEALFWIALSLIVYCYFVYPLLLSVLARRFTHPVRKDVFEPTVAVLISAYNEAGTLERKIKNLLAVDYPPAKLEIFIGSDGSTDQTENILRSVGEPRVHSLISRERQGKVHTINELMKQVTQEIVVFNDVRQVLAPNAIKELVKNFADPQIGCVSGELILSQSETQTGKGVNLYWNYEKYIRKQESRIHSMLGATGAIYAIRKELFSSIPSAVILDDMWVPLRIVQRGFRAVFDDHARAFDMVAEKPQEEYRRKVRTLYGNYQLFTSMPEILNPRRSPVALQLFSHKFLRLLVPFLMILIFVINAFWLRKGIYEVFFILQVVFYGMAAIGGLAKQSHYGMLRPLVKVCYVPYVFCLLNFSALMGFWRFILAKQDVRWEKAQQK